MVLSGVVTVLHSVATKTITQPSKCVRGCAGIPKSTVHFPDALTKFPHILPLFLLGGCKTRLS